MEKQTNKTALIVFTRVPIARHTKTRLFSRFTPEQARDLHRFFLKKAIEATIQAKEKAEADVFFFYTPSEGKEILRSIVEETYAINQTEISAEEIQNRSAKDQKDIDSSDFYDKNKDDPSKSEESSFGDYLLQEGEDLWEKMERAFAWCFRRGYKRVLLYGTDIPEISEEDLLHALYHLNYVDLVIAPTFDNGYYLIGMRRSIPEVFLNIDRNDPNVLRASVQAIESIASYAVMGKRHDVDIPEDLQALIERLKKGGEACKKSLGDILSIIKKD